MGKVHRIKRSFHKTVIQEPWKTIAPNHMKNYHLAKRVSIYIGVRHDGSVYIGQSGTSYHSLMRTLIREWEAGVALGDKSPITG